MGVGALFLLGRSAAPPHNDIATMNWTAIALASAGLAPSTFAQASIDVIPAPSGSTGFGSRVHGLGDIDGDGTSELVAADAQGRVHLISGSGAAATLLHQTGQIVSGLFAVDSDNDGAVELFVARQSSESNGELHVDSIDPLTGIRDWAAYEGQQFIGEAELTFAARTLPSGRKNVMIGVPDNDLWHPAWWYSSILELAPATGHVHPVYLPTPPSIGEGLAVIERTAGPNWLVAGAPAQTTARRGELIFLEEDGSAVLARMPGAAAGSEFGEALVAIGDWDGDGTTDVAALESTISPGGSGARDLVVQIVSSEAHSRVLSRSFPGETGVGNINEAEMCALQDLNGDGVDEIVLMVPSGGMTGGPIVRVLSGRDLRTLHSWQLWGVLPTRLSLTPVGDWNGDGFADLAVGNGDPTVPGDVTILAGLGEVGTTVCAPAVSNSTGQPGSLRGAVSGVAAANDFTLIGTSLPPGRFILAIAGDMAANVPMIGGGVGTLCFGGTILRFPEEIGFSDVGGSVAIPLDLSSFHNLSPFPVAAGETWIFQLWHRDANGSGGLTTNVTSGVEVTFQ